MAAAPKQPKAVLVRPPVQAVLQVVEARPDWARALTKVRSARRLHLASDSLPFDRGRTGSIASKTWQMAPRSNECILRRFFGLFGVPKGGQRGAKNGDLVSHDELIKCGGVPRPRQRHQLVVRHTPYRPPDRA
jgi:hypothetical protein